MNAELERRSTDDWVDVLVPVGELARSIAATEFVPKNLRGKTAAVAACILYGREVGVGPMRSLQSIDVIDGSPTLNAELMRSLVFAAGHRIRYLESTITRCIVEGTRAGDDQPTAKVTYTMDDAKRAKLDGKDNWRKNPRQMLAARATAELCRLAFPDAIGGMPTADELEGVEQVDTATGEIGPPPPPRTAQRRTKQAPRQLAAASDPGPQPPSTGVDEPPLDDEPTLTRADVVDPPSDPAEVATAVGLAEMDEPPEQAPLSEASGTPNPDPQAGVAPLDTSPPKPPADLAARAMAHVGTKPDPATIPATDAQGRKVFALFNTCGWTDRADRLRAASVLVGRDVTTFSDLTHADADLLIDTLSFAAAAPDPQGRLAELVDAAQVAFIDQAVPDAAPDDDATWVDG